MPTVIWESLQTLSKFTWEPRLNMVNMVNTLSQGSMTCSSLNSSPSKHYVFVFLCKIQSLMILVNNELFNFSNKLHMVYFS